MAFSDVACFSATEYNGIIFTGHFGQGRTMDTQARASRAPSPSMAEQGENTEPTSQVTREDLSRAAACWLLVSFAVKGGEARLVLYTAWDVGDAVPRRGKRARRGPAHRSRAGVGDRRSTYCLRSEFLDCMYVNTFFRQRSRVASG